MNKEILRLAIPNIISNISIPLLSSVDTILMGHLSTTYLGAVGIGSMIFNFLYWNFGFLRMGTTGLTAQAFGRKDSRDITATLVKAGLVSLAIALVILLAHPYLYKIAALLMNVMPEQEPWVGLYFRIRIWAAPATLFLYVIMGWYFGMQNAIYPLIITIVINLINIALSAYFVLQLDWGVAGVAWGTVIAQYSGVLIGVIFLVLKYWEYCKTVSFKFIKELKGFGAFLKLNADIFIRTVCLSSAFAFLYSQSSSFGEIVLASNIVLLQFLNWMSYGIDGFAFASESLVGRFKGEENKSLLMKAIKYSFVWGLVLSLCYTLIYGVLGIPLISLFTNQSEVIDFSAILLPWMIIMPIIGFASYIWDGVFIGLLAGKAMRNSMIISFILYMAAYFATKPFLEYHAIWFALAIFLLSRGIVQSIQFYRFKYDLK